MSGKLRFLNLAVPDLRVVNKNESTMISVDKQGSPIGDYNIDPANSIKFGNKYGAYKINLTILSRLVPSGGLALVRVYDDSMPPSGSYDYDAQVVIDVNPQTDDVKVAVTGGRDNIPGLVEPLGIVENLTNRIKSFYTGQINIDPIVPQQVMRHWWLILILIIFFVIIVCAAVMYVKKND